MAIMTSSSTHRLSQVERAMAQLADTLRLVEVRDQQGREEWNRERGEIARKLGTVVEDIVAPSIPRVVATVFGLSEENPLERFAIREQRRANGERREFDAVAAWPGYFLINETKSQLRPEDVPLFVETLRGARRFFPEYQGRKLVGALASLYLDPTLIRYIERQGIIVMGLGDDLMDAKNSPGFRPAEF